MKRETNSGSVLSERAKEIAADIRKINAETKKRIETMTPPCPVEGKLGEYHQSIGSGQAGRGLSIRYICPDGHTFGWNFKIGKGYLIPNHGQGSTPPETR